MEVWRAYFVLTFIILFFIYNEQMLNAWRRIHVLLLLTVSVNIWKYSYNAIVTSLFQQIFFFFFLTNNVEVWIAIQ